MTKSSVRITIKSNRKHLFFYWILTVTIFKMMVINFCDRDWLGRWCSCYNFEFNTEQPSPICIRFVSGMDIVNFAAISKDEAKIGHILFPGKMPVFCKKTAIGSDYSSYFPVFGYTIHSTNTF